jgi:hypothetical protein
MTQPIYHIRVHVENGRPNGAFEKAMTITPFGM